jgi:hypothetical protein
MEQGASELSVSGACRIAGALRRSIRQAWASSSALPLRACKRGSAASLHRGAAARGVLARRLWVLRAAGAPARGAARGSQLSVRRAWDRGGAWGGGRWGELSPDGVGGARASAALRADPATGEPRITRHGQLVADWVEFFAPVVFEPHRPLAWRTVGSLLLDDLPFSVRDPATGRFRIAFRVFCAASFEQGRPKLWRVEAFPDASQTNWEVFLRTLEEAPPLVVCDNHFGLNGWYALPSPTPNSASASGICVTRWSD